jgi:hypothetical protein
VRDAGVVCPPGGIVMDERRNASTHAPPTRSSALCSTRQPQAG